MMMIRTFIVILVALFEASTGYTVINGDVTIVGLFNIHEPDNNQCGSQTVIESVMNVEAVKWYLQHLNAQGGLPLKIGKFIFFSSPCTSYPIYFYFLKSFRPLSYSLL